MAAMVQAQSLRGYRELVADLGGNPTRLLRKAEIEPAALNQLTAFISFESLIDLLEHSAADLGCPDFGLRLAERQDIGILGTLSVAMRYSATVGEAMHCASKYLHVYNAAVAFTINTGERRGQARLELGVLVKHAPRWAQTAEHGVGLAWRVMTLLSEGQCHLQEVRFPHPAVAAEATYRSRFPAPVTFRADRPGLVFVAKDLEPTHQRAEPRSYTIWPTQLTWTVSAYREGEPRSLCRSVKPPEVSAKYRDLRPPPGVQCPVYAPDGPCSDLAERRGHHLRGDQGRGPARSSRTLPVPTRRTPYPNYGSARLQRTVSLRS